MRQSSDMKSRLAELSRPLSITVTSGKGGVGKSIIALSVAAEYASSGIRTLLIDADLGLGNQHLLLDQSPIFTFEDVLEAACKLDEAVLSITDNLSLLPARSGFADTEFSVDLSTIEIRSQLGWLKENFDLLIFDSGAGISSKVTTLCKLTDIVLIVTTPEIAAVADSYAVAKFQVNTDPASRIGLVVNRVEDDREGKQTAGSLGLMIRKFLGCELPDAIVVPECRELRAIVLSRSILTPGNEDSGWSSAMGAVCRMLTDCLPENLSQWTKGHWGMGDPLSLLNIGKENDDTLDTARNVIGDSATTEQELLTSRKDSL